MLATRGDVDMIRHYHIAADGFLDRQAAFTVESVGKELGKHGGDVLDNDNARQRWMKFGKQCGESFGAASGRTDGDEGDRGVAGLVKWLNRKLLLSLPEKRALSSGLHARFPG